VLYYYIKKKKTGGVIMSDREYNFNTQYIKQIIKNNNFTNKKKISKRLDITENSLTLKISQRTLIYINEAIEISDELHMDILDVFCPTNEMMLNLYYDEGTIENLYTKKSYDDFNLNQKYLKQLMINNGVTIKNLCELWGLKSVSIYEKIRGDTKITVKEGILLSLYMSIPVNDLFCPNNETIIMTLSKEFKRILDKSHKADKYIIDKKMLSDFDINNMTVNTQYIKDLLYIIGKKPKDLSDILGLSVSHVYNKINKKIPLDFDEAWKISEFLKKPMTEVFNPDQKNINNVCEEVKKINEIKKLNQIKKRKEWLDNYKKKKKEKKKKKKVNTKQ
jgi:hypothetical protein